MNYKYVIFWYGFIVCLSFVFSSCDDLKKRNISFVLNSWQNREIMFPNNMIFSIQGKDTVDNPINGDYKILFYIDSVGCTSCKLKLQDWKQFMSDINSLSDSLRVQFLFFFNPKNMNEVRHILSLNNFDYPVCIDSKDSINLINHFPSNTMFHTLLLDKTNKVMAMGNPVYNSRIKELYLKIISGNEFNSTLSQKKYTEIEFKNTYINFGDIDWRKEHSAEVVLTNIGKELLVIENVVTSCGCTTVNYKKTPICPGDNLILKVNYQAEHPEHFDKTITVYCNVKEAPFQVKISGNAK